VFASPPGAPKLDVLPHRSRVAVSIDSDTWPYKVLLIRGEAEATTVDDLPPEYEAAARHYFGAEQGQAWIDNGRKLFAHMARIVVRPSWVGLLDFEQRFPHAMEIAMAKA
jgi:hypothetical protein